jgi:parvulin-like peptidyl-prolyl isomerase
MQAKSASIIVQITKWIAILSMAVISLTLTTFSQGQATPTGFAVLHCDEIVGSKVRLRIILMNTMPEAETALERLKEGESFADVARLFSVDNATRANGGLIIGLMSVGDLRKEYQAALNGILPGGTTGIITLEAPVSRTAADASTQPSTASVA